MTSTNRLSSAALTLLILCRLSGGCRDEGAEAGGTAGTGSGAAPGAGATAASGGTEQAGAGGASGAETGGTDAAAGDGSTAAGGNPSAGGASGFGPGVETSDEWADWPMPNSSTDVATGAPHPETYSDNEDGTVTDEVTRLLWQETTPSDTYSYPGAAAYCGTLTLGDRTGWRLPTLIELFSIVDYSRQNPALDTDFFFGTPNNEVWTSTPSGNANFAEVVHFQTGLKNAAGMVPVGTNGFRHVRCVWKKAAPALAQHYTINDGTVHDNGTGLTWQRAFSSDKIALSGLDFVPVMDYCATLEVDGVGAWRVPTAKELLTLIDVSTESPAVDSNAFPDLPTEYAEAVFWSATTQSFNPRVLWGVNFSDGSPRANVTFAASHLRCVR